MPLQQVNLKSVGYGVGGSTAACAYVASNGALAFRAPSGGAFAGRRKLVLWVQTGKGRPDVSINISGTKVRESVGP